MTFSSLSTSNPSCCLVNGMKILVFVGPPKTASRYLTNFLTNVNDGILKTNGWIWPVCNVSTNSNKGNARYKVLNKPFSALPEALIGNSPLIGKRCDGLDDPDTYLSYYRQLFYSYYKSSTNDKYAINNIALGSEYFTSFLSQDVAIRDRLVTNLLTLLPWNNDNSNNNDENNATGVITTTTTTTTTNRKGTFKDDSKNEMNAVIMYRTPRISHLLSIYEQYKIPSKHKKLSGRRINNRSTKSFAHFLCHTFHSNENETANNTNLNLRSNVLHMSQILAMDYGIPTTVIDMAGIASSNSNNQRLDISDVVVCELMNIPCQQYRDENGTISTLTTVTEDNKRVQKDSNDGNTISEEMKMIVEDVLLALDCSYRDAVEHHPLITIMHRHELFSNCGQFKSTPGRSEITTFNREITTPQQQRRRRPRRRTLNPNEAFALLQQIGCQEVERQKEKQRQENNNNNSNNDKIMNKSIRKGSATTTTGYHNIILQLLEHEVETNNKKSDLIYGGKSAMLKFNNNNKNTEDNNNDNNSYYSDNEKDTRDIIRTFQQSSSNLYYPNRQIFMLISTMIMLFVFLFRRRLVIRICHIFFFIRKKRRK